MPSSSNRTVSRTRWPSASWSTGTPNARLGVAVDDLPDHVAPPCCGRRRSRAPAAGGWARAPASSPSKCSSRARRTKSTSRSRSANGRLQPKSAKTSSSAGRRPALGGVVAPVDGRIGLDVLGRDRGAHEGEVVVDVGALQHPGDDRVEERLGELRPLVVDEEADVEQLRAAPDGIVERARVELRHAAARRIPHPLVVEADALPHRLLRLWPLGDLEAVLRLGARLAEEPVVPIEALDHHVRDALRDSPAGVRSWSPIRARSVVSAASRPRLVCVA